MVMVNLLQHKNERKIKRAFIRLAGATSAEADELRDWTIPHILKYLHAAGERLGNKRRENEYRSWKHKIFGKKEYKYRVDEGEI